LPKGGELNSPQENYAAAWADLRWRIRLFWIVFLTYLPGVALITWLWPNLFEGLGFIVAIPWMIAFIIAGFYRHSFGCPRCGKWFFSTDWWQNPFSRKCLHCGLQRWAKPDAS
jgi:hypothetical protein